MVVATAEVFDPAAAEPFPSLDDTRAAPSPPKLNFLSATLGDHMVLQRAPQAATVWGYTAPGANVTTTFDGKNYTSTADTDGTWRQQLPPMQASKTAYTLVFQSSHGERATLKDVLFGDVYICGGQSNMQFSMARNTNRTAEQQLANKYPNIRFFTVGQGTQSKTPLGDLQTIEQKWSVANSKSIVGLGNPPPGYGMDYFSSVCWFFGRQISDSRFPRGNVPIGLISNNYGGTTIELWSTTGAFKACNRTGNSGKLYNAMINPYTVGPMAVSGFTWYQGEANTRNATSAQDYACLFPAMISAWRKAFSNPTAYFGFVQLSTWCGNSDGIAEMCDAQMAALAFPNVGYATNADHGAGCRIHPPTKQFCGERLGNSALALHYGQKIAWRSPSFSSSTASVIATSVTVIVHLKDVSSAGLQTDIMPANYVPGVNCTKLNQKTPNTCAWALIYLAQGESLNATVSVATGGQALHLEAPLPKGQFSVVSTEYGWGAIPLMNAYDRGTGLPVLPWKHKLESTAAADVVIV